VGITIQQIRIVTMFALDPDIVLFLTNLSKMGYAIAFARPGLGSASITPIIPPNFIAVKGGVRVDYDFGRRSLGVEAQMREKLPWLFKMCGELLKILV